MNQDPFTLEQEGIHYFFIFSTQNNGMHNFLIKLFRKIFVIENVMVNYSLQALKLDRHGKNTRKFSYYHYSYLE